MPPELKFEFSGHTAVLPVSVKDSVGIPRSVLDLTRIAHFDADRCNTGSCHGAPGQKMALHAVPVRLTIPTVDHFRFDSTVPGRRIKPR